MFRQLSYYICSTFIVFIFTTKNVSAVTCSPYQTWCPDSSQTDYWCCPSYEGCGNTYGTCISYTTTPSSMPSDLSPGVAVVIVFVSLFFCIMCIGCCVRSQQQQQRRLRFHHNNMNGRLPPHPYQQQPGRRPPRVAHVRSVHNVGAAPPLHIMHEEPPPSYEDATRHLPFPDPSAPSQTPLTTADQANLRV